MKQRLLTLLLAAFAAAGVAAEGEASAGRKNESAPPRQCWSVTQSGNRCKRRAAPGGRYCRQHAADVAPKKPVSRCRSMTPEGAQCGEKPADGRRYCRRHLEADAGEKGTLRPEPVSPDGRGDPARRRPGR